MARISKLLTNDLVAKAKISLRDLGKYGSVAVRLQIIIAAKEHGITDVCRIHGISRTTLTGWIKRFSEENDERALVNKSKKAKSPLSAHLETIKKWVEENSNVTAKELIIKIEEQLKIKISTSSIYRMLKKLRFSYITPRPKHYKQDQSTHEEFKKNLAQKIIDNPEAEVLFFDEARFGTHSKLGHGWYPKGSRTAVKVKLGYKNFYVYGAANHATGRHFNLLMPYVNSNCMNVFLQELVKDFEGKKIILILDGAGWHKSKNLLIPDNVSLIFLPPYSPELNPIERLWLHIKYHTMRSRIYDSLSELENQVCDFIKNLDLENVASICNIKYLSSYM